MCDSLEHTENSKAASINRKNMSLKIDTNLYVGGLERQTAQQLTALAALAEDLNLVLSIHM